MSFDYINEAFRKLDALTEETFDTSLTGLNALADFQEQDDVTDIAKVIDPDADTEDEISDSYVGKVIINCNVCHSLIFETREDVVIDDDGLVNPDMQCPYCGETEGFKVVGEIKEFENKNTDVDPSEDTDSEDTSDDASSEEDSSDNDTLEESFRDTSIADSYKQLKDFLASKGLSVKTKDSIAYAWSVIDLFESGDIEVTQESLEKWFEDTQKNYPEDLLLFEEFENLSESIEDLSLTANGTHVEVTEDEDGKVTLTTEPAESETSDDVKISPVSDETITEIESNNTDEDDVTETDESEDTTEVDVDIEEVDETGFDELGESYLKSTYRNVESFKTTAVSTNDSMMIVEGVLTFNSGVKKNTGFVFEADSINADGKVKFVGSNKHLTESNNAFTLVGNVVDKKLLPESLSCNYQVGDQIISGIFNKK